MSVFKSFESRIAGLVEGAFGRAFRSEVRPVEIARKLTREMEENKTYSLSRTYVPNEYAVYLSPGDHQRFEGFEGALIEELEGYLLEHARRERFALLSRPQVEFRTDERLRLGEFGIQARLVDQDEAEPEQQPRQGQTGHTMVYSTAERLRQPQGTPYREAPPAPGAVLVMAGRRIAVGPSGAVIGRSRDCDVVIEDENVSRRHAELRRRDTEWVLTDLGSTNGVTINGRRVQAPTPLRPGDRLELGSSTLSFETD
jgi:hypothetical protein